MALNGPAGAAPSGALRVAFVVGTLGKAGAEKQLVYMVRALLQAGSDVRVYCLTRGEYYEAALRELGVEPQWIGRFGNPAVRLATLSGLIAKQRPHILQASHFYTNLYAALAAPVAGACPIGAIRNDGTHNVAESRFWGPWLLRTPPVLIVNSHRARERAVALGKAAGRLWVLPNVIDVDDFDRQAGGAARAITAGGPVTIAALARLSPAKRLDRFVRAIALARRDEPAVRGWLVGDGPQQPELERLATELGLDREALVFHGRRDDVPRLLHTVDVLSLTSDHEGVPNAILEAMAASLPVVTTPAGDAANLVEDGVSGFVTDFDDLQGMADRFVRLARSAELRQRLGRAGRERVVRQFDFARLPGLLLSAYESIARVLGRSKLHRMIQERLATAPTGPS